MCASKNTKFQNYNNIFLPDMSAKREFHKPKIEKPSVFKLHQAITINTKTKFHPEKLSLLLFAISYLLFAATTVWPSFWPSFFQFFVRLFAAVVEFAWHLQNEGHRKNKRLNVNKSYIKPTQMYIQNNNSVFDILIVKLCINVTHFSTTMENRQIHNSEV